MKSLLAWLQLWSLFSMCRKICTVRVVRVEKTRFAPLFAFLYIPFSTSGGTHKTKQELGVFRCSCWVSSFWQHPASWCCQFAFLALTSWDLKLYRTISYCICRHYWCGQYHLLFSVSKTFPRLLLQLNVIIGRPLNYSCACHDELILCYIIVVCAVVNYTYHWQGPKSIDRCVPLHCTLLTYVMVRFALYLASLLLEDINDELKVADCIGEFHLLKIRLILLW